VPRGRTAGHRPGRDLLILIFKHRSVSRCLFHYSAAQGHVSQAVRHVGESILGRRLHNAVGDARGALNAFSKLGFEHVGEPLLDNAATGEALRRLVTDELRALDTNDSLILFFAGHGHTVATTFAEGARVKKGYAPRERVEKRSRLPSESSVHVTAAWTAIAAQQ
jgi:hypothetical protein